MHQQDLVCLCLELKIWKHALIDLPCLFVCRIEGFERTYFLLNTPFLHHSHNSCPPWSTTSKGDGTFELWARCNNERNSIVSEGDGREQVTNEDGKGKMGEVRDSVGHTIVVDVLMGTWEHVGNKRTRLFLWELWGCYLTLSC